MVEASAAPADNLALKPTDEFNQERWMVLVTLMAENPDNIDIEVFCYFFIEICNLFKIMSMAMHIAFMDISTKAQTIMKNKEFHESQGKADAGKSLQAFVLMEIGEGIHTLNGKTNSKTIEDSKSWQYTYASTSRTALRDMWLLDYLSILFGDLIRFPDKPMTEISRKAYDEAFGERHPWLIRKAASLAVAAVPSKEEFIQKTGIDINKLEEASTKVDIVKEALWRFYTQHGIDKLD